MFGFKKKTSEIDKEQLERLKYAQKRINQKKRLYTHFLIFLFGATLLIILDVVLDIDQNKKIFGLDWFVITTIGWFLLLIYHFITVFVTHKFMGKQWEQKQLEKLVSKQHERINEMKEQLMKEEKHIAESEIYKETTTKKDISTQNTQELTIVVAADEQNGIGKDNDLIWHLKDDLKHFKNLTSGHHIIMGRKTFESFPKPLPNRTHIVVTRQTDYKVPEGVIVVNTLEKALQAAQHDTQPFIIGGGEIYKQALPFTHKIELTRVHHTFEADTFFPEIDPSIWKQTANVFHRKDDAHEFEFSFLTYERV